MSISIRKITSLTELLQVQKLEVAVWGMSPVPTHQLLTVAKNGGLIIGAFHGEKLVGFNYGFPGFKDKLVYLCSHMMGIDQEYRKRGIGYALKIKQQEEAKLQGYSMITWTFDPLESVNGFLNLSKLKGIAAYYIENLYGKLDDGLNEGLDTDRFQVEWWIDSDHVQFDDSFTRFKDAEKLVVTKINNISHPSLIDFDQSLFDHLEEKNSWLVPVPAHFQDLKKRDFVLAKDWREKTRQIFRQLFIKGFVSIQVLKNNNSLTSDYLFAKRDFLKL